MFRTVLTAIAFLAVSGAVAEVRLPRVAESAASYRASIDQGRSSGDAGQILRAIRRAQVTGDAGEAIRQYERLVALNPDNFRAWLQLGTSWRMADGRAENALAAAYNAYRIASGSAPNQVEALLLVSSVLRARLDGLRVGYEEARSQSDRAARRLSLENVLGEQDSAASNGDNATVQRARDDALLRAAKALGDISNVAADLDEVYREIAAIVPGAQFDRMQVQDARSAVFAFVTPDGTPADGASGGAEKIARIDYRIVGSDISLCLTFNQDLQPSGLVYRDYVRVVLKEDSKPFGIEVKDNVLCLTGLKPPSAYGAGSDSYKLTVRSGLPSRRNARLATGVDSQFLTFPDLPAQVSFAGRRYVLPAGGTGEIGLQATNIGEFNLDLLRISDRTLYRHVALGHVGGDMPSSELDDLKERFGERIWSGTVRVAPGAMKPNDPTRIGLRVRSLVEQRRDWLVRQARGAVGETVSARLPMSGVTDERASVTGEFFVGAAEFETADLGRAAPGLYALVTADASKSDRVLVQWFLETDVGLAFYEGDTTFSVAARSFTGGGAKAGARIELVGAGNRVIDAGTTDEFGVARFPIGLTRGTGSNALVAVLAHQGDDFSFLTFGRERLDLSRLNLESRKSPQGLDAFLTTERGLYQPGETVNLLALVRDADRRAPQALPQLVARIESRDRVLAQVTLKPEDWKLGGAQIPLPIPPASRPGQARITLALGQAETAPVIGEMMIQLGPVRPDRARLDFVRPDGPWARRSGPGTIEVAGGLTAQYLFGVPGQAQARVRNAKAEVSVRVGAAETPRPGCFDGFTFGAFDDRTAAISSREFVDYADPEGGLNLALRGIPMTEASRPMAATVEVTLFDTAGPLASRSRTFPIEDGAGWVGISNTPRLRPGRRAGSYDLSVDLAWSRAGPSGDAGLVWTLAQEQESYLWQQQTSSDGSKNGWQHVRSVDRRTVGSGRIGDNSLARIPNGARGRDGQACPETRSAEVAQGLEVGRYVLMATDPGTKRSSSVRFTVGTSSTDADQLEPNIFVLSTDKATYRPGETMTLTAEIPFERGEVLVAFADGDIRHWVQGTAENRRATIRVPVRPEWAGKGLYALATAYRAGSDGTVAGGPARAVGAAYADVTGTESGYGVELKIVDSSGERVPAERHVGSPDEPMSVEISLAAASGDPASVPQEAYATLYVVDEGLVGLTGQAESAGDPERHFYGRRRFGLRLMDNYDRLLLREGGDRPTRLALSNYTSRRIVSLARGPIRLERGRATVLLPKLDIRNGAASIRAIVWSSGFAAARSGVVPIRSPIVADLDLPDFLLAGDRAVVPIRLQNVDFAWDGEVTLKVAASGLVRGVALSADPARFDPPGASAERKQVLRSGDAALTLYAAVETAPGTGGPAGISVELAAPGSPVPLRGARQAWAIEVRPSELSSIETISFPLSRQPRSLAPLVDSIVADGYRADTVTVSAYFATSPLRLIAAAPATPEGGGATVVDNLVWRGMSLLYAGGPAPSGQRDPELVAILGDLQSLQFVNGSYVPYRPQGEFAPGEIALSDTLGGESQPPDGLIRATLVYDFMSLAKSAGYEVSERSLRAARAYLVSRVRPRLDSDRDDRCRFETAYAMLALVSHSPAEVNRDRIDKLTDCSFDDLDARSAAAAAAARFGLADQARMMLASYERDGDPAPLSRLRDDRLAMTITFLVEAGASQIAIDRPAEALLQSGRRAALSRAAAAWLLRGASETRGNDVPPGEGRSAVVLAGDPPGLARIRPDGVVETGRLPLSRFRTLPLTASSPDERARGRLVIEGLRTRPSEGGRLPPSALRRRYFDLDTGQELNLAGRPLKLRDRVVVVIEGRKAAVAAAYGGTGDGGTGDGGPLLVADLLPSPFRVLSEDLFRSSGFALTGPLAGLKPLGDLRSVEFRPDRWVALINPESRRKAPKGGGEGDEPSPAPSRPPPVSPGQRAGTSDDDVEFRQAYLVQVAMAGRFSVPPISIEASEPPIHTLQSAAATLDIGLPASDR